MALAGLEIAFPGSLTARYAGGSIMLGGIDLLAGLSQNVVAFSYTDNTNDKADDLTVEISDPALTWLQAYVPKKGVEVEAIIRVQNWMMAGDTREFPCGTMWIDEIGLSGPPNVVTVKATSIPVSTGIKTQKQYKFWEDQPLQAIASEIAEEYGLGLVWDTQESPTLKRTDVIEMAFLEYLRDRCKDEGLSLKLFNRQLVIYSEEEYEAKPPIYTIQYGLSQILAYNFASKLNDTYAASENDYVSPETGKWLHGEHKPANPPEGSGSILKGNQRVEDDDDESGGFTDPELRRRPRAFTDPIDVSPVESEKSAKIAKSKLREKNKREKDCSLTLVGNTIYLSGFSVDLVGFGSFSGKWFIESTIHTIGENGYVTELQLRGALEGY